MPGMSGYDVAKKIRSLDPPISDIPLMVFSSSSIREFKKYQEYGINGYLPKPARAQKILSTIEQLLSQDEDRMNKEKVAGRRESAVPPAALLEDRSSVHILLAEDNPINQKLAKFMLTRAGFRLDVAENGKEAVEKYTSNPDQYNLILMDIQMPEMDGREAARVIRDKGFDRVPIIAMTAESMKGDSEKCLQAGMNDFISKPMRQEIVFKIIKKWVTPLS